VTDLLTQLRDYGRQIETDPMLGSVSPVIVDTVTGPRKPPAPSGRWVWALVAAAVIILAFLPLLLNRSGEDPVATTLPTRLAEEGWIAFSAVGADSDYDLYLVGIGQSSFRVTGDDFDGLDQLCPAFSPDGTRIAYGEAEGTVETGYSNGALVVADVGVDGTPTETFRVETGSGSAPPCPTWSPDGETIAAGVRTPLAPPGEPDRTNGDIWIVPTNQQSPTVLENRYIRQPMYPSNLWSDMEWSPEGTELAMTQRQGVLLYSLADGESRTLESPEWARHLSWSPDGTQIVYESRMGSSADPTYLRVAEVDGTGIQTLIDEYDSPDGIGPVWSPSGDQIVYQRDCYRSDGGCLYQHEVLLVTPEGEEVILPDLQLPGDERIWWPNRVTWSPDGNHLLYLAYLGEPDEQGRVPQALIARPIDPNSPPVLLYQPPTIAPQLGDINTYGEGFQLAHQSWGRPVLP
jgi:Tol biopolymer transport system component